MNEDFRRHDDEEESAKTRKSIEDLRKETQKLFKQMDKRQRYIVALMRKMSLLLDEEARDVLKHRLKNRGLKLLRMSRLELQDIEVDIYGKGSGYCIVGKAKAKVTPQVIEEVDKDIERLCSKYPSYIRGKMIKVVYSIYVTPEAVEEARRRGIWLVTATKDLTPLMI